MLLLLKEVQLAPTADLYTIYHSLSTLLRQQSTKHPADLAREQRKVLPQMSIPLFAQLQHKVAHAALKKLAAELRLSRQRIFPSTCTCVIRNVMGLPCGHLLASWNGAGMPVPLSVIHQHRRFELREVEGEDGTDVVQVLEPLPRQQQRRNWPHTPHR
jgi:hypothetical protein